jgi:hypothetical protein
VAHATDVPAYRTHVTAVGNSPTVQIAAEAGDLIVVLGMYNGHLTSSQLPQMFSYSDGAGGAYNDPYCGAQWNQGQVFVPAGHGKPGSGTWYYTYAKWHAKMRTQLVSSTGTLTISVNTSGRIGTVAVIAISGLTAINGYPPINGCGTLNTQLATVRQVKANLYCANCGNVNPILAGTTPLVPKSTTTQQQAFLSSSLIIAVAMNDEAAPSPAAPSGWTQRFTVGTTANSDTFGMTVSTRDAGFSGTTVTWSSTTPTDGNAAAIEIQAIQ